MADTLRLVRYDETDQLVSISELESAALGVKKLRGSFQVLQGARSPVMAASPRRRGGSRQVSERMDNGTIGATWIVSARTPRDALARVEQMLADADDAHPNRFVLWKPEGADRPGLYELAGAPSAMSITYDWAQFISGKINVTITWPVRPDVCELVQDAYDDWRVRQLDHPDALINCIPDPGFENADAMTAGWNWSASTAPNTTIAEKITTWSENGTQAARVKIIRNDGAASVGLRSTIGVAGFPCKPLDRVYLRGLVNVVTAPSASDSATTLRVYWWKADGTASATATSNVAATANNFTGQVELAGVATAPADAAFYSWSLINGMGSAGADLTWEFYVDGVVAMVLPGVIDPPIGPVDGDLHNGRWTGVANQSPSALLDGSVLDGYAIKLAPGSLFRRVARNSLHYREGTSGVNALVVDKTRRPFKHGWVTVKGRAVTGAVNSSYTVTPGIGYADDGRFYWATVEGANLRLYEFDGVSANTQRATGAITAPTVGTSYWVRIRRTVSEVVAEYWTTEPTPTGTPTQTATYTWGSTLGTVRDRAGYPVVNSWAPGGGSSNQWVTESYEARPYSYRLVDTPAVINVEQLPGTRTAAVDVDLSVDPTDADYPRHLLLGWRRNVVGDSPTGWRTMLIPGEGHNGTGTSGGGTISTVSDGALYRGGQALQFALTNADASSWAEYRIDPTIFEADEFDDSARVAVFVRYRRSSTAIVAPRLRVESRNANVDALMDYTPEFGAVGRYLPTNGSGVRTTSLGTLRLPRDEPEAIDLRVTASWAAGTTAGTALAIDEVYVVPISGRAHNATGVSRDDGAYSPVLSSATLTRRIKTNLRGAVATVGQSRWRPSTLNMTGTPIEMSSAKEGVELLVRPSVAVPDDPSTSNSDILGHDATVHLRVTPRHQLVPS